MTSRQTHPRPAGIAMINCKRENGVCKCRNKLDVSRRRQSLYINRRLCGDKYDAAIQQIIEKVRARDK